ncbi:MAG: ATP-dependent RecD-like DNA helicase [Erysipelotrichaceae bacterium]
MQLKGNFEKIIYQKPSNGYLVGVFIPTFPAGESEVVVTGYFGSIKQDRTYLIEGNYIDHPVYGIQFKCDSFSIEAQNDRQGLINYFSGVNFKGIGKKYAAVIVDYLQSDPVNKIRLNNDILDDIPNMNSKRKQAILAGIAKDKDDETTFLLGHHLTMADIAHLRNTYKDQLMSKIMDDPYQMIYDIDSINFAKADKFALSIGISRDNFYRLAAYSCSLLMEFCMKNGDSYCQYEQFQLYLQGKLPDINTQLTEIIAYLQTNRRIVIQDGRLYPVSQYDSETFVASYLANFPYADCKEVDNHQLYWAICQLQDRNAIEYQSKQLQAITSFFENDLMIITGGPGTGKTTIVSAIMELANQMYPQYNVQLLAPTGRAAKRLSQLSGCQAKTIHSVLLWDKETGRFAKDEKNPITSDILIIDEFSMVDVYLFAKLLKAAAYCKKIVLIGDSDQLPSVAPGALLRDLIDSNLFYTIKLDKIYRQKEGSDIIKLAYDIKNQCVETIPCDKDIRFFECDDNSIADVLLQVVKLANKDSVDKFSSLMNVQVLAPMHKGANGIDRLNSLLQQQFNPAGSEKKELKVGYRIFREEDKILQLKNQPDDDVFNGDIGFIKEIIYSKDDINNFDRILVDFDGKLVEYTNENFANITHGYCMSVHKAQGSEYPIVILPMTFQYSIMLQKRLIYTAISRAYQNLIIIGSKAAFYKGINNNDHYIRKTYLKERLWQIKDE